MTRARDIANLVDANGDIVAGALDNANDASALTTGTLPVARVPYLTNKNLIINGSQIIAQRATSATGKTVSGYYTCDRWQQLISSAGTWTFTQDTSVPSGEGFAYSYKWDCTTADGSLASSDYLIHRQNIEGQNLQQLSYGVSGAKSVTLSFWVKSNKTGTYVCELRKGDDAKHIGRTYAISSANTWEYKTVTFTGDTSAALVNTNATGIKVHFWLAAGSSYTSGTLPSSWASNTTANQAVGQTVNLADNTANEWYITGVQLEVGSATPFEHRSFGDELARCQRYYFRTTGSSSGYGNIATVSRIGNTLYRGVVEFPVTMRSRPSFSSSGSFQTLDSGFTFSSMSGGDGASFDSHGVQVTMTSNGSAGQSSLLRQAADGQAALIYDAEL